MCLESPDTNYTYGPTFLLARRCLAALNILISQPAPKSARKLDFADISTASFGFMIDAYNYVT